MSSTGFLMQLKSNTAPIYCKLFDARRKRKTSTPISRLCVKMMAAAAAAEARTSFGFKNLMETFTVNVQRAENRALNVPLVEPFTIASSRLEMVENVAIRIELSDGCVGWGEAPILPFVTAEDQPTAMAKAEEVCELLRQRPPITLSSAMLQISETLPGHEFASVSNQLRHRILTFDFIFLFSLLKLVI